MSLAAWRTAYGSAAGTSHARTGAPCQDFGRCDVVQAVDGGELLIASLADGAGSAAQSEHGARLVVESFQARFARAEPGVPDEASAQAWLAQARQSLAERARADGRPVSDYACTFAGAVIGPSSAAFIQIGDGAIVVAPAACDGEHDWIFWPQHGEFANSTFFVTMDDAADLLQFTHRHVPIREVALFSDGLERLILDMRTRRVHSPSLRPILDWLAATPPSGDGPSEVLVAYLNSAQINRRTDDDKTLVMATRAPPGDAA